jgi:hypothetical protein
MGILTNEEGGNFVTINHESTIVNHLCNIEPPYDDNSTTSKEYKYQTLVSWKRTCSKIEINIQSLFVHKHSTILFHALGRDAYIVCKRIGF